MESQTPCRFIFGPQEGFEAIPYLFTNMQLLQLNLNNLTISNQNYFFRKHFFYLKNRFEFQTWSNLWCFEISQVILNQDFLCQQTAFTLIQKRNSSGSIPSMLPTSLCSITARPWGHHHQCCFQPTSAVWSFGSCAKHQPRPEPKKTKRQTPSRFIFGPQEGFDAIPYLHTSIQLLQLNLKWKFQFRGRIAYRKDCLTNPCRSKIVTI